jgi:membrane protein required for beta-lactamase induction
MKVRFTKNDYPHSKAAWRKKAQTNICMAKELVDIFGGAKADYLKRLNHRLRMRIAEITDIILAPLRKPPDL